MSSRRSFLQQSSVLTAGLLISKKDWYFKPGPIGVQLYTVRDAMAKDPKGSLEKIAKLGYKQVETYGYKDGKWFGYTPAELLGILNNNGLTSPSGHTFPGGFFLKDGWEDGWKKAVADSKTLGQQFIVVPYLEDPNRTTEAYKKLTAALNKAGEMAQNGGLNLAYHNHDFEFKNVDGQTGFDLLVSGTDPKLVFFELDLYWAAKAGHNPIDLFAKHPGRFAMWHVKDMDNTPKKFFTEVGKGVIDFRAIFKKQAQSGMKYFFVEQDVCPGSPFDSLAISIDYLRKIV